MRSSYSTGLSGVPADFIIRASAAGERPAEVLRLLIHAILDYQHNNLPADATMLLFEWHSQQHP